MTNIIQSVFELN